MFKIEVINLLGEKENHYWMNKKEDDFLRFLPKQFGVPVENINVYVMEDEEKDLYEAYLRSHENNEPDMSEDGAIKVKRKVEAKFKVGDKVKEEDYLAKKEKIKEEIKATKIKLKEKTKLKKVKVKEDESDPNSAEIDMVEIEADDDLAKDHEETIKEFRGKKLKQWPYDKNGKFLGNKTE